MSAKSFHRSCSCGQCKRGRGSLYGQFIRNHNERKLRRMIKIDLAKKDLEEVDVRPISSPYTD